MQAIDKSDIIVWSNFINNYFLFLWKSITLYLCLFFVKAIIVLLGLAALLLLKAVYSYVVMLLLFVLMLLYGILLFNWFNFAVLFLMLIIFDIKFRYLSMIKPELKYLLLFFPNVLQFPQIKAFLKCLFHNFDKPVLFLFFLLIIANNLLQFYIISLNLIHSLYIFLLFLLIFH